MSPDLGAGGPGCSEGLGDTEKPGKGMWVWDSTVHKQCRQPRENDELLGDVFIQKKEQRCSLAFILLIDIFICYLLCL